MAVVAVTLPSASPVCVPSQARKILVADPKTWKISSFGVVGNSGDNGRSLWHGGVLANNGKIYCIPFDADAILVIDPAVPHVSTFGAVGSTKQKVGKSKLLLYFLKVRPLLLHRLLPPYLFLTTSKAAIHLSLIHI